MSTSSHLSRSYHHVYPYRLYAFYADAFSLHGRTIAECYSLVHGLSLPPTAGYYQKEERSPFLWREQAQDGDTPLMQIDTSEPGPPTYRKYPHTWLERAKFVVIGVKLQDADAKLDVFPATWRAVAYIISDAKRMKARPLNWDISPSEYASARVHALFRTALGEKELLAERHSKEDLGLTDFSCLPDPEQELQYYHYLSVNSGLTDDIVDLFGISYRCWHGCGYLGWPGFPLCRFFLLRNEMIKEMTVQLLSGTDRFMYDPSKD